MHSVLLLRSAILRILNLSTADYGGAGSAALRIHNALQQSKFESILLVKHKKSSNKDVYELRNSNFWMTPLNVCRRLLNHLIFKRQYQMFGALPVMRPGIIKKLNTLNFSPDIVMVHWISNFIDIDEIHRIKKEYQCSLIFYFMDMANFTGGCHFSSGCTRYEQGCTDCPAERGIFKFGFPRRNIQKKITLINDGNVSALAPNQFVSEQVRLSKLFRGACNVAYLPIDPAIFFSRTEVSDEGGKIKILFGSSDLNFGRKGGDLLLKMLKIFDELARDNNIKKHVEVIIPGLASSADMQGVHYSLVSVAVAVGDKALSDLYRQVDLFICCSREDSGPMMVSESMMSGVPVLAFEVGICPELINDGVNGFLVKNYDYLQMAKKLLQIAQMDNSTLGSLKQGALNTALLHMTPNVFQEKIYQIVKVN